MVSLALRKKPLVRSIAGVATSPSGPAPTTAPAQATTPRASTPTASLTQGSGQSFGRALTEQRPQPTPTTGGVQGGGAGGPTPVRPPSPMGITVNPSVPTSNSPTAPASSSGTGVSANNPYSQGGPAPVPPQQTPEARMMAMRTGGNRAAPPSIGGIGATGTVAGTAANQLPINVGGIQQNTPRDPMEPIADGRATGTENNAVDSVSPGPAHTEPSDIDRMSEDLARRQLEAALAGGDTAKQERLMAEAEGRATGRSVVNARAAAGRAGMAMSGSLAAQANDIRQNAARDLALQQIGVRTTNEQRLLGNANEAQRIDIAQRESASNLADAEARRAALAALLGEGRGAGGSTAAPGGGGGGVTNPLDPALDDLGGAIGDATGISDGTSPFGQGTDQTDLASSGTEDDVPGDLSAGDAVNNARTVGTAPPNGQNIGRSYASDGKQYDVYRLPDGSTVRVQARAGGR